MYTPQFSLRKQKGLLNFEDSDSDLGYAFFVEYRNSKANQKAEIFAKGQQDMEVTSGTATDNV